MKAISLILKMPMGAGAWSFRLGGGFLFCLFAIGAAWAGEGAWCIETGWTQAWITLVLSMRKLKTSLWKLGENSCVSNYFQKEKDEMFRPDAPL